MNPKYSTAKLESGLTSIPNEDYHSHLNEDSTTEMIEKLHNLVANDREVHEIAESMTILINKMQNILNTHTH